MSEHDPPVILVTGASGGVGRGIAVALGGSGWTVWIAARRPVEGREVADAVTAAGGRGRFIECDVSDGQAVAGAVAAVTAEDGRLDGVVHNATSALSPIPVAPSEVTAADLREHVAVSLRGAYLLARATHGQLVASGGSMVLLTSEAGFVGKMRLAPYAAVKGAVRGLARAWAREWGPDGVRVNCVAPLANVSGDGGGVREGPDHGGPPVRESSAGSTRGPRERYRARRPIPAVEGCEVRDRCDNHG